MRPCDLHSNFIFVVRIVAYPPFSLPSFRSPSLPLYITLPPFLPPSLPPSLLSPFPSCVPALNQPDAKDSDIQAVRDILVDSLFAVLATAGQHLICICLVLLNPLPSLFCLFWWLSPLPSPPFPSSPLGAVPVIRCPRGNAAEMVAQALDKKLRDNLRDSRNNVFSGENMTFSQLR